jgi:hypothetical protein
MGTYDWRVTNAVVTSRWWILDASIVESTLLVGHRQLDIVDAVGVSSWRVTDAVGKSSRRDAIYMSRRLCTHNVMSYICLVDSGLTM